MLTSPSFDISFCTAFVRIGGPSGSRWLKSGLSRWYLISSRTQIEVSSLAWPLPELLIVEKQKEVVDLQGIKALVLVSW